MADIVTNTLQIGSNNLILQDAGARQNIATNTQDISDLKDGLTAVETQLEQTTADALNAYVTDTANGAIASFPDGADGMPVKSLTVDIEPVQDLHGQDNPYPAGGGKNKFRFSAGRNAYSWSDGFGFSAISANDDGITFNGTSTSSHSFSVTGASLSLKAGSYRLTTESDKVGVALSKSGTAIASCYGTASGGAFTLSEDTSGIEIQISVLSGTTFSNKFIGIQIESGSDATAWSPYENICPISGHDTAKVTRTGKNLLVNASDTYTIQNAVYHEYTVDDIKALSGKTVTFSIETPDIKGKRLALYAVGATNDNIKTGEFGQKSITLVMPDLAKYEKFRLYLQVYTADQVTISVAQLELGSTATTYEPYQGQTVTIDLDGTRYGGTLDVGTGVLTVDRVKIIADGTNIKTTGGYGAYGALWLPAIILSDTAKNSTTVDNLKASYLKTTPSSVQTLENSICIGGGGRLIVLHIGTMQGTDGTHGYNSANEVHAAVNAYLQSNNLEICYRLAEPTTVQLTAQEVSTLLGQNNIFADCGDVTAEYRADTKLYIQKVINS